MKIPLLMLPHRATIIPFLGSGAYGPKWETDEKKFRKNVHCLIESKIKQTTDSVGTTVTQKAEGIFPPNIKIKANDKVIWNETGAEYKVVDIDPIYVMGPHSIEVVLI